VLTQYCLQTLAKEMSCSFCTFLTILIQQDIFRLNGFFINSHLFTLSLPHCSVILSVSSEAYYRRAQVIARGQWQCAGRTLVKTDF